MSLIPQFKTELQYIPTVKACLKLSQVDCFCLRLKGSLARDASRADFDWEQSRLYEKVGAESRADTKLLQFFAFFAVFMPFLYR